MGAAGLWRTIKHPRQRGLNGHQRGAGVAPPPRTPLPLPVRGGSCWDGGSGGESYYSLGDAGATWGRVGIRGMDVFCQDGGAQPPAGLLFDYPPAWNRALCRFIDAERRRFRGRSIRMELDLNGRLQAAVTTGLPLRVCTAPAATTGLRPSRTSHPLGTPPHPASATALALGYPVQSRPGPAASHSTPSLTAPSATDPTSPPTRTNQLRGSSLLPILLPSRASQLPQTAIGGLCGDSRPSADLPSTPIELRPSPL